MIVSVGVNLSPGNFFNKGYLFFGKKDFGLYFFYSFHQVCLNPVIFYKFCKVFKQVCASFKILFVSGKSSLKTEALEKRAKIQWKKLFGIHLLLSSSLTDFRWQIFVFTLFPSKIFGSFKILSLGARKSSGNIFKESCLLVGEKSFRPFLLVSSSFATSANIV